MAERKNPGGELLTPEQRAMLNVRYHDKMKGLSPEGKQAFKKKLRDELHAMSEEQLARTKAVLQAAWDNLPADRKAKKALGNRRGDAET